MSLTIEQLQTIGRTVTPIAMDLYDKENSASILPLLAAQVQRRGNGKIVSLEWWAAFPQMLKWLDEKVIQNVFRDDMTLEIEPYEVTFEFDRIQDSFDDALLSAQDLGGKIAVAFAQGKVLYAYAPMRNNEITYDGQNFFDTDHVHPNDAVFSNVVASDRVTVAAPTVAEARAELKEAMARIQGNSLVRNVLVTSASATTSIVVFVRSFAVWQAYEDLRTEDSIGDDNNRFKGKFELVRDFDPLAGQEDSVDVVQALPGGPRSTVMAIHKEVGGLEFGLKDFMKRNVPFGMEAMYAFGPGFPQVGARIVPS